MRANRTIVATVVAMTATTTLFLATAGCPGIGDFCHPDEGPPDPRLCGPFDAGTDADASDAGEADASDAGDAAPLGSCPARCMRGPPSGWDNPQLLWTGPEGLAPACPDVASDLGYDGHADVIGPTLCGECRCGPSEGTCALPASVAFNVGVCGDAGAPLPSLDPPPSWDGSCLSGAPPTPGSATVAPLTLTDNGCAPSVLEQPMPPATWATFGRACRGFPVGSCEPSGNICVPPPLPGWSLCIFKSGTQSCPPPELGPWSERHVFYTSAIDTRSCSTCSCGPPVGAECDATVALHTESACSTLPVDAVGVNSIKGPICVDVALPPGAEVEAVAATPPIFTPGTCEAFGGQPTGSVAPDPTTASTFCCIPSP